MAKNLRRPLVSASCRRLLSWIANNGWQSYDTFDGGTNPFGRALSRLGSTPVRALIQVVKTSPVNLRPVLGTKRTTSAKSVALIASGHLGVLRFWSDPSFEEEARRGLQWLIENRLPGFSGACWGYPFDAYTRSTTYLRGTPTLVATSFIGQAFVDGYERLGGAEYLAIARGACDFVLRDLAPITNDGLVCMPYHPGGTTPIHNANLLGVALLSRVYRHTGEPELFEYARRACRYSLAHQSPAGAWPYGEGQGLRWVDGFHTGFVLDSLHYYVTCTGDEQPLSAIERGLDYYRRHLFVKGHIPKFTDRSLYPIDVRCASQAIQTFSLLSDHYPQGLELAWSVAAWAVQQLQHPSGYFYYQIRRLFTNKIPFVRWSQGPMLCALATLLAEDRTAAGDESSSKE